MIWLWRIWPCGFPRGSAVHVSSSSTSIPSKVFNHRFTLGSTSRIERFARNFLYRGGRRFSSGSRKPVQQWVGPADLGLVLQAGADLVEFHGDLRPLFQQVGRPVPHAQPKLIGLRGREHFRVRSCPLGQTIGHEIQGGPFPKDGRGAPRRRHRQMSLPRQSHQRACQAPVHGPRREGRDARGLHAAVERLVVGREPLVVRAVPRLVDVQDRHHQARPIRVAAHAAGGLDVLGAGLRLPRTRPSAPAG